MGCGASDLNPARKGADRKRKIKANKNLLPEAANNNANTNNPLTPQQANAAGDDVEVEAAVTGVPLLGKQRYIAENGAVVMAREDTASGIRTTKGHLIVYTNIDRTNLVFVYVETGGGPLFVKEYKTDDELTKAKTDARVSLPWAPFFKSIASDVIKSKAVISNPTSSTRLVSFTITSSKDPNTQEPFTVKLELLSRNPSPRDMATYVLSPMTRMTQAAWAKDPERELRIARAATGQASRAVYVATTQENIARLKQRLDPLRQALSQKSNESRRLAQQLSIVEFKLNKLEMGDGSNQLDKLYTTGGPMAFTHAHFATPHMPKMPIVNEPLAHFIAKSVSMSSARTITENGDVLEHSSASDMANEYTNLAPLPILLKAPTDPTLGKIYNIIPSGVASNVMQTLHKLEDWDYNIFDLEEYTQGNGLFYTCYSILHRLDLPSHFKIEDRVLQNFLRAVQAGYHPNPYHNKTHAADVCQINYYILMKGGLLDKCKLTKEDLLASVLAGAIHDYDHPGFNNSLHTRTNSYLATLYNDRSVLENHHLACVFEMMRLPQFDVFRSLSDEQRRGVRDTMIEMVLATDMSNHAKIFEGFKRTISDHRDWSVKEQKVEAMCMSLKLADISNCSRPRHLYMEWAKNISAEFFQQGDAEARLGFPISPFMDRKKERLDFPQGQISFMNFIVIPMVELMTELLPKLEPAVAHCQRNKDEWQQFLKAAA